MTWVIDRNCRSWVEREPWKRRKPACALRFAQIKVGDQLMKDWRSSHYVDGASKPYAQERGYYIVTDLLFDPAAGERDEVAGQMVAIKRLDGHGELVGRKQAHTRRGLASQGFNYADRDFLTFVKARAEAGNVVGIGFGRVVRQRPKFPGL